ncbi:MAG: glycosyltransferase family 9 protein [Myxococcales bacterium]|nr:glycosyltransferase family 9 protein [Myxococcales bacterium]
MLRLGAVGDVVRTLPAASALRDHYREAHIAWLVEPAAESLLRAIAWLDEVIVFPRGELRERARSGDLRACFAILRRFREELRRREFDTVVDFHAILKSGLLAWLSGAPRRVSYAPPFAREGSQWLATHRAALGSAKRSRFDRNLGLVRYLGIESGPRDRPFEVAPEAVRAALESFELAEGEEPPVVLNPGTSPGAAHKRYTVDGYADVARRLRERGVASLVTWGPAPEERAFAEAVVAAANGAARLAPATPSLVSLAALLSCARLYIGSDTGPMHLASLVGTPVVQLMGPTDPVENEPFAGTPWRRVRVQIACNPCRRGCSAALCMGLIRPVDVVREALDLLTVADRRC